MENLQDVNMEELLGRINELAAKKKSTGLNEVEQEEQHELRQKYLKIFRGNFKSQLENTGPMHSLLRPCDNSGIPKGNFSEPDRSPTWVDQEGGFLFPLKLNSCSSVENQARNAKAQHPQAHT